MIEITPYTNMMAQFAEPVGGYDVARGTTGSSISI
jgi:hypothetical protein